MIAAKRRLLWAAWGLSFAVAIACAGVFVHGVVRDKRPFDPDIRLDLGSPSGWVSAPFRVWGEETYALLIRSVNHDPEHIGRPLRASLEVRVLNSSGQVVLRRSYGAEETGHTIPDNYGDVRLATLRVSDWPFRSWTLQARVTEPDPDFTTVYTDVELREQRPLVGMEGLITYALIIPSGVFMLMALLTAVPLARHGSGVPFAVTAAALMAFLFLLGFVR